MTQETDDSKILLTPKEAAQTLSLCDKTLRGLTVPHGPIPVCRIGRAVRYLKTDLLSWAISRRETTVQS